MSDRRYPALPVILTTATVIVAVAAIMLALQGALRFVDTTTVPSEPLVTARVEPGQVIQRLTTRGTFVPAERDPVQVPQLLSGARPVITSAAGTKDLTSGTLLMKVADRPTFVLAGAVPMYRALSFGMSGPDVIQLRAALTKAGYPSDDRGDQFGLSTARAVYDFYAANGVKPTDGGGNSLPNRWQVANTVIPMGEIIFFGTFPAHLAGTCGAVGDTLVAGACFVESNSVSVVIAVSSQDAESVKPGLAADVQFADGTRAAGHVTGEVPAASKEDGDNASTTVSYAVALDESPSVISGSVTVSIVLASSEEGVLTVPAAALRTSDQATYWIEIVGRGGRETRVTVDVGLCEGGVCEVASEDDSLLGAEVRISGGPQ